MENIPTDAVVVMAKHQSAWETVGILCHLPRGVWIIKRELVWVPIIGWVLAGLQSIAINRKSGRSARDQILDQGRDRMNRGYNVFIFPEGGIESKGQLKPFKNGAFRIAIENQVPIVPITFLNNYKIQRDDVLLIYPQPVRAIIHKPIDTTGMTQEDVEVLKNKFLEIVQGTLDNDLRK